MFKKVLKRYIKDPNKKYKRKQFSIFITTTMEENLKIIIM